MKDKVNVEEYLDNIISTLSYSATFFDDMRQPDPVIHRGYKYRSKFLIHFGNLKLSSKKSNIELICNFEEKSGEKLKRLVTDISVAVVLCYKKIAMYLKSRLHLIDSNLFENIKKFFEEGDRFAISLFGYKSSFQPYLNQISLSKEDSDPVSVETLYHELLHYYYYVTKDSDNSISHMTKKNLEGFYVTEFDDKEYESRLKKLLSNILNNINLENDLDGLMELTSSTLNIDKELLKKQNLLHVSKIDHFDIIMNKLISITGGSEPKIEKILRLESGKEDYEDFDILRIALAVDQNNIEKSMIRVREALSKVMNYDNTIEEGIDSKYSALKALKKLSSHLNQKGFVEESDALGVLIGDLKENNKSEANRLKNTIEEQEGFLSKEDYLKTKKILSGLLELLTSNSQ
jgi:hypothetical protein